MNNGTVSTEELAVAMMRCTGSVAATVCDGDKTATSVNVDGVSVVMVDPKAELAEVMELVAVRKSFYKKALASLQRIYEVEKTVRAEVKAGTRTKEDLAEVMAQVMGRKKFYNRAAASLQNIYKIENRLRAAIKIAKVGK